MFAQSSMFQRDERPAYNEPLDRGSGSGNEGGNTGNEGTPIGSGIAILLGLSAGYAYFKRKGEE